MSRQKSRQRYYLFTLKHLVQIGKANKDMLDTEDGKQTIEKLEFGVQPTAEEILSLKSLFEKGPLSIKGLAAPYAR
jgi:hypothetical protein